MWQSMKNIYRPWISKIIHGPDILKFLSLSKGNYSEMQYVKLFLLQIFERLVFVKKGSSFIRETTS